MVRGSSALAMTWPAAGQSLNGVPVSNRDFTADHGPIMHTTGRRHGGCVPASVLASVSEVGA
jgi:hypothetical protein